MAFKALPVRFYYDQGVSTTLLALSLRFTVFYAHIWKRSGNAAQWNGGISGNILLANKLPFQMGIYHDKVAIIRLLTKLYS